MWSFWGKRGTLWICESLFWTSSCESPAFITVTFRTKLLILEGFFGGDRHIGNNAAQGPKKFEYQVRLVLFHEAKGCRDKEVIKTVIQMLDKLATLKNMHSVCFGRWGLLDNVWSVLCKGSVPVINVQGHSSEDRGCVWSLIHDWFFVSSDNKVKRDLWAKT